MKQLFLLLLILPVLIFAQESDVNAISSSGIDFSWEIIENDIKITLTAPAEGWIAIGFNTKPKMDGANMILAYVKNNDTYIRDDSARFFFHSEDKEQNVTLIEGKEENGFTTVKFTMPLDSGDDKDLALLPDTNYSVMLAYASRDNYTSKHSLYTIFDWQYSNN